MGIAKLRHARHLLFLAETWCPYQVGMCKRRWRATLGDFRTSRPAPRALASHDVEVVLLDAPVRRDGVEIDVEQLGAAIHLPQHRGAVVIAPDDVGLAVGVE